MLCNSSEKCIEVVCRSLSIVPSDPFLVEAIEKKGKEEGNEKI